MPLTQALYSDNTLEVVERLQLSAKSGFAGANLNGRLLFLVEAGGAFHGCLSEGKAIRRTGFPPTFCRGK